MWGRLRSTVWIQEQHCAGTQIVKCHLSNNIAAYLNICTHPHSAYQPNTWEYAKFTLEAQEKAAAALKQQSLVNACKTKDKYPRERERKPNREACWSHCFGQSAELHFRGCFATYNLKHEGTAEHVELRCCVCEIQRLNEPDSVHLEPRCLMLLHVAAAGCHTVIVTGNTPTLSSPHSTIATHDSLHFIMLHFY